EGCVVDDASGRIFLGEEDYAVWVVNLDLKQQSNSKNVMQKVIAVGDHVRDDIEGLALYHGQKKSYLIISSQGNDSYVVLEADAPYRYRGAFRIGLNIEKGIDAASETDGLEVSHHNFGGHWQKGILVVQDGHKRMPETNQNFKIVSWEKIAKLLNLE
ncbi:MAG: phytase, partial [Acinetobacter sp.]